MIHFGNEDHGREIMAATGSRFSAEIMTVISRAEDVLKGGVVYENWTGRGGSVVTHIAGFAGNWVNRDLLWVMFHYPFVQLDCKQGFAQVKANNKESLHFVRTVGFKPVITLRDVFPDDDMILLRLYRDECRFLNIKPRSVQFNKD